MVCLDKSTLESKVTFSDLTLLDLKSEDDIPLPTSLSCETYCKHVAFNFGAVDALVLGPSDPPALLQMTVGK